MAIAQTFVNNTAEGCFVTSLDLYFSEKDSIQPITIGLLETYRSRAGNVLTRAKPKRKMSAWNKYVKANSKKPRFRYRNGKLNLKKMGVAFRKTPAGRKKT